MYISDLITSKDAFKPGYLNLITAGCGTGKSYFVANHLPKLFPDVKPCEILFVTSRSLTAEQQAVQYNTVRLLHRDEITPFARFANGGYWHGEQDQMQIMTFDKLGIIVENHKAPGRRILQNIKIVVIDECHALLSDRGFMRSLSSVLCALHLITCLTDTLFIGLTATPDILKDDFGFLGLPIRNVLPTPIYAYQAKQLYVAHRGSLDYFLDQEKFPGRTIVLCRTATEAEELTLKYENSALLVSQTNDCYCAETMVPLRKYIAHYESIPEYYEVAMGDAKLKRKIDILFTTTTMREGVTLKEKSGVRNVICMIPDKLHVIQFVGRCRYDVDMLAVLDTESYNAKEPSQYIANEHLAFRHFLLDDSDAWFDGLEHIVRDTAKDVRRVDASGGTADFAALVNERFVERKIKVEDKRELVSSAKQCGIFVRYNLAPTFKSVVQILTEHMGYAVAQKRVAGTGDRYWWIARKEEAQPEPIGTSSDLFAQALRERWLVSTPAELDDYSRYIYSKEGRAELVKCAKKYGVLRGKHHITYTAVIDYIINHLGYYRHTGRHYFHDGRHNYDVICAFPQKEEE